MPWPAWLPQASTPGWLKCNQQQPTTRAAGGQYNDWPACMQEPDQPATSTHSSRMAVTSTLTRRYCWGGSTAPAASPAAPGSQAPHASPHQPRPQQLHSQPVRLQLPRRLQQASACTGPAWRWLQREGTGPTQTAGAGRLRSASLHPSTSLRRSWLPCSLVVAVPEQHSLQPPRLLS